MTDFVMDGWLTTGEAAQLTGYSVAYLRQLANRGRVEARKAGRDWLINEESLRAHKREMDSLGAAKHSPWRDDLTKQGRGRGGENEPEE